MNINTKSNFLQKKKQERKKTQQQIEIKSKLLSVQKNLKAYLIRRRMISRAARQGNVQCIIMLASDISIFEISVLKAYIKEIQQLPAPQKLHNIKKLILSCMRTQRKQFLEVALALTKHYVLQLQMLFRDKLYSQLLLKLLKQSKGSEFLRLSWKNLKENSSVSILPATLIFETIIASFQKSKMQQQGIFSASLTINQALNIIDFFCNDKLLSNFQPTYQHYKAVEQIVTLCLKQCSFQFIEQNIKGFTYLTGILKKGLKNLFEETIKQLMEQNKNLLSLIQDEQQLQYFQNKMKMQSQFQNFCQLTLPKIQQIFQQTKILHLLMLKSQKFRQTLLSFITQINFIYDDRKIMFVYQFLSDQISLKQLSKEKNIQFYATLNMRLITMDDEDFKKDNIFDLKQWRQIIQLGISKAFENAKKLLYAMGNKKQVVNIKNRLFKKRDQTEGELEMLSNLLNNLNKKSLRTNKIPQQYFINNDLDKYLNTFKFGMGARSIQLMLKNFAFTFRFESRLNKLKQFIDADKLNHDRSLFLQDEVDPDLIIEVRRGHEFLDAFDSCFYKDFRKKYKIVFFNEQGLEEEGIDGGGIIKQFINRILKSSFSDIYGMFYETQEHEILPNPYCPMNKQYEFVGKIVGKAVYEGINIQQKFSQPFLNLLIGRQNTFQDLQFIDKQIYKSMLDIRRMGTEDLEVLQQTFTILDVTPFGQKRYVNLKNQSGNQNQKNSELMVNSDNKIQFVLSYADFKCNKQIEQKTRLFRKGFLTVMKSEWLSMFSNQQLNLIISGSNPNYSVVELKNSVVYNDYHQKSQTVIDLWTVLSQFTPQQKSAFLFFVTSCSRPPTMGFQAMKPLICIQRSNQLNFLPTANTCMNVLRLPDYKNKQILKQKLLYAINAKAGFEFA